MAKLSKYEQSLADHADPAAYRDRMVAEIRAKLDKPIRKSDLIKAVKLAVDSMADEALSGFDLEQMNLALDRKETAV